MAKRSYSTKIDPEAGYLGSRLDGTALPMLLAEHYRNVDRAARHPDMASYAETFQKLREGRDTLGREEVRELRHAARHPDFEGALSRSLSATADLHDAARAADEGRRTPSHAEIRRDVDRVIKTAQPRRRARR